MSYIGGLSLNEFRAFLQAELKPTIEENKALREEVANLRKELQGINKELYTIEDLETLFSVSKATIHNWMNEGKLIKHKIGGRTLFKRDDIDKIIEYSKNKK